MFIDALSGLSLLLGRSTISSWGRCFQKLVHTIDGEDIVQNWNFQIHEACHLPSHVALGVFLSVLDPVQRIQVPFVLGFKSCHRLVGHDLEMVLCIAQNQVLGFFSSLQA